MDSDEYYAHRDSILVEVNDVCSIMDNDNTENINRLTHELIWAINKWREKNGLNRYLEFNRND